MNKEVPEPIKKQLCNEHKLWLENPTTQTFLSVLKKREMYYDNQLVEGIRVKSDEKQEEKLRASISTCKAISLIVSDSDKFVEHSTK